MFFATQPFTTHVLHSRVGFPPSSQQQTQSPSAWGTPSRLTCNVSPRSVVTCPLMSTGTCTIHVTAELSRVWMCTQVSGATSFRLISVPSILQYFASFWVGIIHCSPTVPLRTLSPLWPYNLITIISFNNKSCIFIF